MSMNAQTLTVVKFKDKLLPKNIIDLICGEYKSGAGLAFAEDGEITLVQENEAITPERLTKWCEQGKDVTLLMSFTKADKSLGQADLQPFVVLRDAKDKVAVVASIIGDFTTVEDEGSSERTTIGIAVDELLMPELAEIFTECGGNFKSFFEQVAKDNVRKSLLSATKKGWITFLAADGSTKSIIKGDLEDGKLFDKDGKWGWMSLNLTLPKAEKPKEEKKPPVIASTEPVKPPKKNRDFGSPVPADAPPTMPAPTGPVNVTNNQPDTAIPPPKESIQQLEQGYTIEGGALYFQCPEGPGYENNAQVRGAYERAGARKPGSQEPYKHRPKLLVTDPDVLSRFSHLIPVVDKKVEEPPQKTAVTEPALERIISKAEKEKLASLLLDDEDTFKNMSNIELPPEQELESELPSFIEASGFGGKENKGSVLNTMRFRDEFLATIQEHCPVAFRQLLKDWRCYGIQMAYRCKQLEARIEKLDKPDTTKPAAVASGTPQPQKKKREFT